MAFKYTNNPRSVVDEERGISIEIIPEQVGPDYGERLEYNRYIYTQDSLKFLFKVAKISTPSNANFAPIEGDLDGVTQPNTFTFFILKNSLRDGLVQGLKRPPSSEEYQHILSAVKEGFDAWVAGVKHEFPDKEAKALIAEDMASIARKYPGRMPNYESWARAYKKTA